MKIAGLTKDSFSPWGAFIAAEEKRGCESSPDFDYVGNIAVVDFQGPLSLTPKARDIVLTQVESHRETPEMCVALRHDCVIFVAGDKAGAPDAATIRAFLLKEGDTVVYAPGVWHWVPYAVGADACSQLIVYRDQTGRNDFHLHRLESPVAATF